MIQIVQKGHRSFRIHTRTIITDGEWAGNTGGTALKPLERAGNAPEARNERERAGPKIERIRILGSTPLAVRTAIRTKWPHFQTRGVIAPQHNYNDHTIMTEVRHASVTP